MITVEALNKCYGKNKVLNNLSFTVEKGQILGILGPNGAGKSTTMKILSGYIPPDNGKVVICGYDIYENQLEIKKNIGYLPETVPLYPDMRVREYLLFRAQLKELKGSRLKDEVVRVINECWLEKVENSIIGNLSKGYRQRTGLADALLNDPKILILDEPTSGLDPEQIIATRNLIKRLKTNKAIIISTHILSEVDLSCDRVLILNNGNKVAEDSPENLKNELGNIYYEIEIYGSKSEISIFLNSYKDNFKIEISDSNDGFINCRLYTKTNRDPRVDIYRESVIKKWIIRTLKKTELKLEDAFMNITNFKR